MTCQKLLLGTVFRVMPRRLSAPDALLAKDRPDALLAKDRLAEDLAILLPTLGPSLLSPFKGAASPVKLPIHQRRVCLMNSS